MKAKYLLVFTLLLTVGCSQQSNVVDEVVEDDTVVIQEELSEEEKQAMIDNLKRAKMSI